MGGSPLCSIARGQGKNDDAEEIMGNSFALLVIFGIILTIIGFIASVLTMKDSWRAGVSYEKKQI